MCCCSRRGQLSPGIGLRVVPPDVGVKKFSTKVPSRVICRPKCQRSVWHFDALTCGFVCKNQRRLHHLQSRQDPVPLDESPAPASSAAAPADWRDYDIDLSLTGVEGGAGHSRFRFEEELEELFESPSALSTVSLSSCVVVPEVSCVVDPVIVALNACVADCVTNARLCRAFAATQRRCGCWH